MKHLYKSILALAFLCGGASDAQAGGTIGLGIKKSSEFIMFELTCEDSAGIDALPDSAHVFTRLNDGTTNSMNRRNTVYPFIAANPNILGIDTSKVFGDTTYWYSNKVFDIDGSPTEPTYTLSIDVVLYCDFGLANHNKAIVQVIADSLNQATAGAIAALKPTTAGRTIDILATGEADVNLTMMGGVVQSAIDLKDFADDGYEPIINTTTADIKFIAGLPNPADSLASSFDGYANSQLTNRERLFTNLDATVSSRLADADINIASGIVEANIEEIENDNQSSIDFKDMVDVAYEPTGNAINSNIIQVTGTTSAADSLKAWLLGYINTQLTNREHLFTNLDEVISTRSTIGDTGVSAQEVRKYMDTLIYIGEHGLGIFVDSTAGNTNTVIGTDGTEKNPVSTLAAARTLALALGAHRFYIHGGSTFNGAGTDLAADYSAWEFYGEGFGIEIGFGGQLVTNSFFHNVGLSGAMHPSGGDVHYVDCQFGFVSSNFQGHAEGCEITDTLVTKPSADVSLHQCFSGLSPDHTPTIDFGVGSNTVAMTSYSGGIRVMNGSSNDSIAITTDGHVIVSANNTSLRIMIHGMINLTDSGTTTNITKDAVFSRKEADLWVWANVDTALTVDTSELGTWLSTGISASLSDANMGAIADSVWKKDTTGLLDAGKYGLEATTGGAASITDADMGAISDSVWDKAKADMYAVANGAGDFLQDTNNAILATAVEILDTLKVTAYDNLKEAFDDDNVGSTMLLRAFNVTAAVAGSSAVNLTGNTSGEGMTVTGGSGGSGALFIGGSAGGNGMFIKGGGTDEDALVVQGTGIADGGSFISLGTGSGMRIDGGGAAIDLNTSLEANNFATDAFGSNPLAASFITEFLDSLFETRTDADTGSGSYYGSLLNDLNKIRDSLQFLVTGGAGITDADMAAIADSVWFAGLAAHDGVAGSFGDSSRNWAKTSAAIGSGAQSIVIGATDTSGTDTLISGVPVTVRDAAGNQIGQTQLTNGDGYTTWGLTASAVISVLTGSSVYNSHVFNTDVRTFTVGSTGDTVGVGHATTPTDTVLTGNDIPSIAAPTQDSTCSIFGDIVDSEGNALANVTVTWSIPNDITGTCNNATILKRVKTVRTNSAGRYNLQLIWSSCLQGKKYNINFSHPKFQDREFTHIVPDSTSHLVVP